MLFVLLDRQKTRSNYNGLVIAYGGVEHHQLMGSSISFSSEDMEYQIVFLGDCSNGEESIFRFCGFGRMA